MYVLQYSIQPRPSIVTTPPTLAVSRRGWALQRRNKTPTSSKAAAQLAHPPSPPLLPLSLQRYGRAVRTGVEEAMPYHAIPGPMPIPPSPSQSPSRIYAGVCVPCPWRYVLFRALCCTCVVVVIMYGGTAARIAQFGIHPADASVYRFCFICADVQTDLSLGGLLPTRRPSSRK